MKTTGTALEWFKTKPEAYIRHPNMQKGTCLRILNYYPRGIKATYPSGSPSGEPWLPHFSNQCPYMVNGRVKFSAYAIYGLIGSVSVISDGNAFDSKWYEVDPIQCYEEQT